MVRDNAERQWLGAPDNTQTLRGMGGFGFHLEGEERTIRVISSAEISEQSFGL